MEEFFVIYDPAYTLHGGMGEVLSKEIVPIGPVSAAAATALFTHFRKEWTKGGGGYFQDFARVRVFPKDVPGIGVLTAIQEVSLGGPGYIYLAYRTKESSEIPPPALL